MTHEKVYLDIILKASQTIKEKDDLKFMQIFYVISISILAKNKRFWVVVLD